VGRNFCDISGSVTRVRNNRLRFSDDDRGLVNCVDKKKNRLGVCCFDTNRLSIFNRRRVRQDEIQINEDGVLGLDTIPQDDQSDEVFINEDLLNGIFAGQADSFEEDQSIEDIINQVKNEQDETPSILMVKDNGASGKDVVLRFPDNGQEGNFQGSNPIVVINIRAENIDLDDKKLPGFGKSERTKQVQINEDTESFRTSVTPPAVEIDRDLLKDLEAEIMTMLTKEEGRQKEEVEEDKDYLDFDTDVITITMESDLSDLTQPWGPPVRQVRHRPGIRRPLPFFRRSQYPREVYYQYQ